LRALQGHEGGVISLRWDHTGTRLLSGSWDGTARIWDIATSECIAILPGHENGKLVCMRLLHLLLLSAADTCMRLLHLLLLF
jgi:WD40 repeat protein